MFFSPKQSSAVLEEVYYNPKTGYSGIADIQRKTELPKQTVEDWLQKQTAHNLHKPIIKRFKRRKVYVPTMMHQWQTDIVDMSSLANKNSNYKYILTIIDVFSKIGFAFPLKTKSGPEVANVLSDVFKQHGAPIFLQSDKGLEFLNKHVRAVLKEFNIISFLLKAN